MDFSTPKLNPLITKEFLLSKHSEETYMTTYLKLPIQKGLQVSPLRKDKRPTCSFCRSKNGDLMFHDFGTGFHANFIGVVMEIHKCTYKQALRIIAEDFGLVEKLSDRPAVKIKTSNVTLVEKSETIIQVQPRPFTTNELKWWKNFGITPQTLKKYKVCACESVFLNGNYFSSSSSHIPIYGYYCGKKHGQELWRLYFPSKRTFRFSVYVDEIEYKLLWNFLYKDVRNPLVDKARIRTIEEVKEDLKNKAGKNKSEVKDE